jgi:hypothetical protein
MRHLFGGVLTALLVVPLLAFAQAGQFAFPDATPEAGTWGLKSMCSVTASAPTYVPGQIAPLSCDASGNLRTVGGGGGGSFTETNSAAILAAILSTGTVQGTAAAGAAFAGNPVGDGCRGSTALPTAYSDGNAVAQRCDVYGELYPAGNTPCQPTTNASVLVCDSQPGTLVDFSATVNSTVYASTWYLLGINAASNPGSGAVTPILCQQVPAGQPTVNGTTAKFFATGIVLMVSSTGCFTATQASAGNVVFIAGSYH